MTLTVIDEETRLDSEPLGCAMGPRAPDRPLVAIVDDDASMREAMKFVLQTDGLRTITFDTAAAFLDHLPHFPPACIVLDIRMPGMSGLDLFRRLVSGPAVPPVILVSAHLDDVIERDALAAGVVACICKPFTDEALLRAVRAALRR